MNLVNFYNDRIASFRQRAGHLQRKENRISLARLVTFVLSLVLFFLLFQTSTLAAIAAASAGIVVFAVLVRQYNDTERKKNYFNHLVDINILELKSLGGDSKGFADGASFIDRDHPNSYDLDLFGPASVFQFLNRTTSQPGAGMLAEWLMIPADIETIKMRQEAIKELQPEIEWRQQIMTLGFFSRQSLDNPGELLSWIGQMNEFSHKKVRTVVLGLSTLTMIMLGFVINGWPASSLLPVLLVNFIFYFIQGKNINRLHQRVSKSDELAQTYAGIIGLLEDKKFGSEKLLSLQHHFKTSPTASAEIKKLSRWVSRLDSRLNIMVSIPLNLFFFWDIHCCLALENWKTRNAVKVSRWIESMAEFEVLNSISNTAFNNPEWVFPSVIKEYFTFSAINLGHPLIPSIRRITNNIDISGDERILIVTGSNMSGKSTFLRTCGVNAVLALAGAPVCATSLRMTHAEVFSSMRISDSLEDNTSSFYAELKRLAAIIRKAEQDPNVFLLLDEILRGTNSNDRYAGSVALVKQLSGYRTAVIIATHDLKLAGLEKELPGQIHNYHFDVKVDGEELYFDYKLMQGICTSMNASILMKKMGIRI